MIDSPTDIVRFAAEVDAALRNGRCGTDDPFRPKGKLAHFSLRVYDKTRTMTKVMSKVRGSGQLRG